MTWKRPHVPLVRLNLEWTGEGEPGERWDCWKRAIAENQLEGHKCVCVDCDPPCVCRHRLSSHNDKGKCTAPLCACGPGCIHEGFVDARGQLAEAITHAVCGRLEP